MKLTIRDKKIYLNGEDISNLTFGIEIKSEGSFIRPVVTLKCAPNEIDFDVDSFVRLKELLVSDEETVATLKAMRNNEMCNNDLGY